MQSQYVCWLELQAVDTIFQAIIIQCFSALHFYYQIVPSLFQSPFRSVLGPLSFALKTPHELYVHDASQCCQSDCTK